METYSTNIKVKKKKVINAFLLGFAIPEVQAWESRPMLQGSALIRTLHSSLVLIGF